MPPKRRASSKPPVEAWPYRDVGRYTPIGEIEQWTSMLRSGAARGGWRSVVVKVVAWFILLGTAGVLVFTFIWTLVYAR